jgi:hypothetical protein
LGWNGGYGYGFNNWYGNNWGWMAVLDGTIVEIVGLEQLGLEWRFGWNKVWQQLGLEQLGIFK